MVWDMVVIWVRAISTSGWYCVGITCFRAKVAQYNWSACLGGKERDTFKICFYGAISNSSCTNSSLRVSSGSNFLGNTPRPEHFGIPQRIATRHPKKHLPLHPPFPTSASAFSNHVGPSECAVLRQEEDWYGRIPVARSRIGCEVINYEPVLTGCSYRSRPLQERQRPNQGQRQTPLSYATRDPPFQGERNATGSYRM